MEAGIRANQNRMNIKRAMPLKLARFWLICLFFALWACAIGVRLFWLQIVRHKEYVERAEDIAGAIQRSLASGKPAVVHVEVDRAGNSTFAGIPGFQEFRKWYGEDGDFLGVPGLTPRPEGTGNKSTENSSGY